MRLVRSTVVLFFVLICSLSFHAASAQSDSINCATFSGDQAAAQDYFDANGQPAFLDGDGDGQACASPEDGDYTSKPTASTANDITCASFSGDQAAAQEYFDANGQPAFLDGDGDGQACASPEDGDYTSRPTAGPESSSAADSTTESVQNLPETGAGSAVVSDAGNQIGILLAMSLLIGTVARLGQRQLQS